MINLKPKKWKTMREEYLVQTEKQLKNKIYIFLITFSSQVLYVRVCEKNWNKLKFLNI